MSDDYTVQPPDFEHSVQSESSAFFPPNADTAWMLKLIEMKLDETSLPSDIKESMSKDMSIYLTEAGMTNISKYQVIEFINGFKEVWYRYIIFKVKKKYRPELYYTFGLLRELFILRLNKSVDGWQGDHVFERRTTYDITQKHGDLGERVKGFFFKKKVKKTTTEEEG